MAECETSLERMRRGLEILCSNEEARLAFCFSNKAINVQWKWRHRTDFIWRPFQLAFILLNVESIVNPGSKDREACDLLWVPTGAGKTEAYLALIAFVLAFRRRRALIRDRGDRTGAGVTVITRYTLRLLTIQQFRRTLSLIAACEYLRVFNLMQRNQRVDGDLPAAVKPKITSGEPRLFLWASGWEADFLLTDFLTCGAGI